MNENNSNLKEKSQISSEQTVFMQSVIRTDSKTPPVLQNS